MPRRKEVEGKIQCISCKDWKHPVPDFHRRTDNGRPYSKCKACHIKHSTERLRQNPPPWYVKDVNASKSDAKAAKAISTLTAEQWFEVVVKHDYCCYLCGTLLTVESKKTNTITLEHIVPLLRGGTNSSDNVAPACFFCNSAKRNMTLDEFKGIARKWAA